MSKFLRPSVFNKIPIGGQFIEVMATCNEIATRIEPDTINGKLVNARRSGGKRIFMADWEPVFIK